MSNTNELSKKKKKKKHGHHGQLLIDDTVKALPELPLAPFEVVGKLARSARGPFLTVIPREQPVLVKLNQRRTSPRRAVSPSSNTSLRCSTRA